MSLFTREELEQAQQLVAAAMPPTPQYRWPLLEQATGTETWVKHENHSPTGAFKVRGAISFIDALTRRDPHTPGIITATRGNHGQGQARMATRAGMEAVVLVPHGNSVEKNAAMRAFGAELIEHGADFDTAKLEAARLAAERGLTMVPPFHRDLVAGVASYALELFTAQPDLHTVYVPIGCGSGICGLISVRDALGLDTRIVGVVSTHADAAKTAYDTGVIGETATANTFADGMAVRVVVPEAYEIYSRGAERIISVTDNEIAEAMRVYYGTTHNLAEGAGAAPLAGLLQERNQMVGKSVAVILCGGNVDADVFAAVIAGNTPVVG